MAYPYIPKAVFGWIDWLFFGFFCFGSLGLLVAGILTPGNSQIGLALMALVCLSFWFFSTWYYLQRRNFLRKLHFISDPGLVVVGWTDDKFVVSAEQVELQIKFLLVKITPTHPLAVKALIGCVVIFREPTWIQYVPELLARKVAGIVAGQYVEVGWTEDLSNGALQHELAHIIIRAQGKVVGEKAEHNLMRDLGIA